MDEDDSGVDGDGDQLAVVGVTHDGGGGAADGRTDGGGRDEGGGRPGRGEARRTAEDREGQGEGLG